MSDEVLAHDVTEATAAATSQQPQNKKVINGQQLDSFSFNELYKCHSIKTQRRLMRKATLSLPPLPQPLALNNNVS